MLFIKGREVLSGLFVNHFKLNKFSGQMKKFYHYNKHHFCKACKCMLQVDSEDSLCAEVNNKDTRTRQTSFKTRSNI